MGGGPTQSPTLYQTLTLIGHFVTPTHHAIVSNPERSHNHSSLRIHRHSVTSSLLHTRIPSVLLTVTPTHAYSVNPSILHMHTPSLRHFVTPTHTCTPSLVTTSLPHTHTHTHMSTASFSVSSGVTRNYTIWILAVHPPNPLLSIKP